MTRPCADRANINDVITLTLEPIHTIAYWHSQKSKKYTVIENHILFVSILKLITAIQGVSKK